MTYGPHSFAVSGPCAWNDLAPTLHASPGTLRQFQGSGGARTSRQPGHFQVTKVVRQVIRCKRQRSKGAGHFEVRKSSSQVTLMHFFPQKS